MLQNKTGSEKNQDDDGERLIMYDLNRYGKIVVDSKEVYLGCVTDLDQAAGIVKLLVVDWRDRDNDQKIFNQMIVPLSKFTIKYLDVEQ